MRSHSDAAIWQRGAGTELWQAFSNEPCDVPLLSEPQGEAICYVKGFACGYLTVSEEQNQPIYYFERVFETDFNGDCVVDLVDLSVLVGFWLETNCLLYEDCSGADLDQNGIVTLIDFILFGKDWFFSI